MTFGSELKFIALESSLLTESFSPGNPIGLIPPVHKIHCLLVKALGNVLLNTWVASTASGLSIDSGIRHVR